ncbi:uncharacterized protein EAF02_005022 [Botrytis sinoallii]|uniref:uncharacterized protein n=1 Tax=Botrytis sinoallii TaxID=1463999 RepID=UPI001901AE57|nr:uncharacterized protein EAF02_005022 [Botrytis sinoallii]KAF7884686.1 hypothetical protein EAF02_005022 [Botrytis sinoallii]
MNAEMGTVWNKPYPWASGFHTRTKRSIKVANIALKKCSKVLRIQSSNMTISDSNGIAGMIWLRLLATCKQGGGHLLQHPLVTNLSIHEAAAQDPWSLDIRVIWPLKTLEILGIDVFANQWYDTWVLETLWQIFRVNSAGAYNAETSMDAGSIASTQCSTIVVKIRECGLHISRTLIGRARSFNTGLGEKLKKGEEVCVSYIEVLARSKMERRKALAGWLSGDCKCKRCLAE